MRRRWKREVWRPRVEVKPAVEEKLAEKLRPVAAVVDSLVDFILMFDLDGKVIHVNPSLAKACGYKPEELVGKRITEIGPLFTPAAPEHIASRMKECMEKSSVGPLEMPIRMAREGREGIASFTISLIKDAEGNPQYFFMILRDISEVKRLAEEAVAERLKLEAAYGELSVLERARTFTFILFKNIFEPLLRQCKPETLVKVRDELKGLGVNAPIAAGISITGDGSVSIDEVKLRGQLATLSPEESFDKLATTSSIIMDACYPLIQANLGSEKASELVSGVFSTLFERPDVSAYKPYLLRVVPEGVEVPRGYILLEVGRSYLVEERKPAHASKIFSEMVSYGFPGLCISTTYPTDTRREHGIGKGVTVLWLSKAEKDYSISPSSLGMLRDRITSFAERNENSVVLLDGLEYLIATNGFDLTFKFLHDLMESVTLNRSRLIVPVSPATLEARQLALLERSMEPIEVVEEE